MGGGDRVCMRRGTAGYRTHGWGSLDRIDLQGHSLHNLRDVCCCIPRTDFTTDPVNFPAEDFKGYVDRLHESGRRYMMIFDPGISSVQAPGSYPAWDKGIEMNVFINGTDGTPFIGKVWPGYTTWPDFFHPNASEYWTEQVKNFHDVFSFDGMWIDMVCIVGCVKYVRGAVVCSSGVSQVTYVPGCAVDRIMARQVIPRPCFATVSHRCMAAVLLFIYVQNEPSNFCNDECKPSLKAVAAADSRSERGASNLRGGVGSPTTGTGFDPVNPPYVPGHLGGKDQIYQKTIGFDAMQYPGLHYHLHNMYGYSETIATMDALKSVSQCSPCLAFRLLGVQFLARPQFATLL